MINPRQPDYRNTPASDHRTCGSFLPTDLQARPAVSIVTPFFNAHAHFEETMRCMERQTFQQWEWIIVNDASAEPGARALLDSLRQSDDPRIRVVDHPHNRGPSAARNTGIAESRAGYLFMMDADDLIEPTTIEKSYWFLYSHPNCPWVNGWSVAFGAEEFLWRHGFEEREIFLRTNILTVSALFRKETLLRLGGYDEAFGDGFEDWLFWLKAAEEGLWGATIPDYFYWYRKREQHWDRWKDISDKNRQAAFAATLPERFPKIHGGGFPAFAPRPQLPFDEFEDVLPAENLLRKGGKRLVFIIPWMVLGGADKYNLDVLECLVADGWQVTLVTTRAGENTWRHEFARFTPEIFVLHDAVHPSMHPLFLRYIIHSRQADAVLMSNSEAAHWFLPYLRTHFPRTAFLDYSHMEESYWKNGGYPRYAARAHGLLDANLVSSRHLRDWMMQRSGAGPEHFEVIHTNIDATKWNRDPVARARLRAEAGIGENLPVILFAGRICAQKQPEVLARVLRELRDKGLPFRAWIAGDGENRAWLADFVARHNLGAHVRLLGSRGQSEMRDLLSAADIFFLPSHWEGIALSIFEAMAMGLAVVGAEVGGQAELVVPGTGILIRRPANDTNEEVRLYVEAFTLLLSDPSKARGMGARGRVRIEEDFPLRKMVQELVRALDGAIGKARERPSPPPGETAFAHEAAIRAVEYLRLEQLAEELWRRAEAPNEAVAALAPAMASIAGDPLREWNHIHRYIPFRLYRWWHVGWISPVTRFLRVAVSRRCYDENLDVDTRLRDLTKTRFYRALMRWRKYPWARSLLPRPPTL
ncbi:MAG: glycosyltransferase [Opitutales bacterium]|nr:glycosyltransferase [Opitutales bacterium]